MSGITTWLVCLLAVLIIPVLMVILGKIFRDNPPKEINNVKGYRTRRSMASQEAWDYANRLMGRIQFIVGLCLLLLSVIAHLFFIKASLSVISIETFVLVMFQTVVLVLSNIPVEKSLKEKF